MKANILLKKILTELGKKHKFAQETLDNATILEAESFASGNEVFIVSEEDRIALPVGEYTMSDGSILVCTEEGMIAEIKSSSVTEEAVDESVAIEAEDEEITVDVPSEIAPALEEVIAAVVEVIAPMIEEVKEELTKIKEEMGNSKEKMSKQVTSRPIKHSPKEAASKSIQNLSSGRSGQSTMDKVLEKMAKFR